MQLLFWIWRECKDNRVDLQQGARNISCNIWLCKFHAAKQDERSMVCLPSVLREVLKIENFMTRLVCLTGHDHCHLTPWDQSNQISSCSWDNISLSLPTGVSEYGWHEQFDCINLIYLLCCILIKVLCVEQVQYLIYICLIWSISVLSKTLFFFFNGWVTLIKNKI